MWCFSRTDRVDMELFEKMRSAGINWVFMGIESGNDSILANAFKNQNREKIYNASRIMKDCGINFGGNFVFGLQGDTIDTMKQTLDLAMEIVPDWANFFVSMAYPGTKLYDDNLQFGVLPVKWGQYGFFSKDSTPLPTETLSSKDIIKFRDYAFDKFFKSKEYKKKIIDKFGEMVYNNEIKKMADKSLERV
jgi:radical SAM superfamily enzyme YgiQ (UPF0313 family)